MDKNNSRNILHDLTWIVFIIAASGIALSTTYDTLLLSLFATYLVIPLMYIGWRFGDKQRLKCTQCGHEQGANLHDGLWCDDCGDVRIYVK